MIRYNMARNANISTGAVKAKNKLPANYDQTRNFFNKENGTV